MNQDDVAALTDSHDMTLAPADRVLDLTSEVGELSKEVLKGTDYGRTAFEPTDDLAGELGDVYFCLLALAAECDVDAEAALEAAVEKYRERIESTGDAGSGE